MATRLITVPRGSNGNFKFQIQLDSVIFGFRFNYNRRAEVWYFDLLDRNDNPIRRSNKVTTAFPWLRQVASGSRPLGELLAIDTTASDQTTDFDALNDKILFLYEELATVPT